MKKNIMLEPVSGDQHLDDGNVFHPNWGKSQAHAE